MAGHASSRLTYSVTRPYPFRDYTLIATALCAVLLIPVTVINVATSGFELVTQTSLDPNRTVSQYTWNRWLSGTIGNIQSTCPPALIPAGSQLLTNNSALTYTLMNALHTTHRPRMMANQMSYLNNPLETCVLGDVQLSFETLSRSPAQLALHKQGLTASAELSCTYKHTSATFAVAYDYVPGAQFYRFPGRKNLVNSSLLLGEALLRMHWLYTTYVFYQENAKQENPYAKTQLTFRTNFSTQTNFSARRVTANEISSVDFFTGRGQFFTVSSSGLVGDPVEINKKPVSAFIDSSNSSILPAIWAPADALAKVFRDTVLADVGQVARRNVRDVGQAAHGNVRDVEVGHNILTNTEHLERFTANFTQMRATLDRAGPGWASPSADTVALHTLPTDPFTAANASQYHLQIAPSTFGMSYLCQVPQLKPSAPLFFAVLIADLVIMQALWKLFQFVSDYVLVRKYPERFGRVTPDGVPEYNPEAANVPRVKSELVPAVSVQDAFRRSRTDSVSSLSSYGRRSSVPRHMPTGND